MSLLGTLDTLSLPDLFELLASTRKSGALHVRSERGLGIVYFSDGKVCGGEAGDHSGPVEGSPALLARLHDVCFELFRFEDGSFEFEAGRRPAWPVAGEVDVAELLSEARRRLDEWRAILAVVPSLEVRPRLVAEAPGGTVTLDATQWRVVTGIDGRRKVSAVIRVLDGSEYEVCKVLAGLVTAGLVDLDGGEGAGERGLPEGASSARVRTGDTTETRKEGRRRPGRAAGRERAGEEEEEEEEEERDGGAPPPVTGHDDPGAGAGDDRAAHSALEEAARAAAAVEKQRQKAMTLDEDGLNRGAVVAFLSGTRKQ